MNIFGTNFVDVRSVRFGVISVYFAVVSPTQILAVTHAGLGQGNYTLNVTTATGYALSSTTFEALPLELIPVYDKEIFSYVGVNITTTAGTGGNNDKVTPTLKFKLLNTSWTVTSVTFNPVNFEPQSGSLPYLAMAKLCGPTTGVYLYRLTDAAMHNYLRDANEFDFVFGVTVSTGTSARTTYVFTNDETRNFILPAGKLAMTVMDDGQPTNGFTNCL